MLKNYLVLLAFLGLISGCDEVKSDNENKCDFNVACHYENDLVVSLSQNQITPEMPFQVIVKSTHPLTIYEAYIEGVNMYMGKIPLFFEQNNQQAIADAMLGVCSEPNMQWQITIKGESLTPFTITYPILSKMK